MFAGPLLVIVRSSLAFLLVSLAVVSPSPPRLRRRPLSLLNGLIIYFRVFCQDIALMNNCVYINTAVVTERIKPKKRSDDLHQVHVTKTGALFGPMSLLRVQVARNVIKSFNPQFAGPSMMSGI